jgi:hypothetical protein
MNVQSNLRLKNFLREILKSHAKTTVLRAAIIRQQGVVVLLVTLRRAGRKVVLAAVRHGGRRWRIVFAARGGLVARLPRLRSQLDRPVDVVKRNRDATPVRVNDQPLSYVRRHALPPFIVRNIRLAHTKCLAKRRLCHL